MGQHWYYVRANQQAGPVSAADLKQLASAGQLSPTDLVGMEGMSKWVAAGKIKGLFGARTATAPAAPSFAAVDPAPFSAAAPDPNNALPAPIPGLFRFVCPKCNSAYEVPFADSGTKFNCRKCGQRIQVPTPPQNKTVLGKLPGQEVIVEMQVVEQTSGRITPPPLPPQMSLVTQGPGDEYDYQISRSEDDEDDEPRREKKRGARRERPRRIVVTSTKSVGISILLTILFGPLGMFYSTVLGGLIMMAVNVPFLCLVPCTAGLSALALLITWPICVIWGAMAVKSYNEKLGR